MTNPEQVRTSNIIDMALTFTAMMRIFAEGSKDTIGTKLKELFSGSSLEKVITREHYEAYHQLFCDWFTREIRTAERNLKNGSVQKSEPASYGQAAKVLDITIKVYVYYCGQPTAEVANRIVPFLNGAIDTPITKHLKNKFSTTIRAKTIREVDERVYRELQSRVHEESQKDNILPVQYDDIMWRRLSRQDGPRTE